jgi:hypothetical protein
MLHSDPLIAFLNKKRDFLVHRGMLLPQSGGSIGITEGRGMKLGLGVTIDPLKDSDDLMYSFAYKLLSEDNDFLGFFNDDEDSLPCIEREWKLEQFPDEVVDLCAKAWLRMGKIVCNVLIWLGDTPPELSLDRRHSAQRIRVRLYDRAKIREKVAQMQKASEPANA